MPNAYIVEVAGQTAGIVARDQRGYRFFASDRFFDSLDGQEFSSARHAERAAQALLRQRRDAAGEPLGARRF